jgi:hypothetical protein
VADFEIKVELSLLQADDIVLLWAEAHDPRAFQFSSEPIDTDLVPWREPGLRMAVDSRPDRHSERFIAPLPKDLRSMRQC